MKIDIPNEMIFYLLTDTEKRLELAEEHMNSHTLKGKTGYKIIKCRCGNKHLEETLCWSKEFRKNQIEYIKKLKNLLTTFKRSYNKLERRGNRYYLKK